MRLTGGAIWSVDGCDFVAPVSQMFPDMRDIVGERCEVSGLDYKGYPNEDEGNRNIVISIIKKLGSLFPLYPKPKIQAFYVLRYTVIRVSWSIHNPSLVCLDRLLDYGFGIAFSYTSPILRAYLF
jgi:hypothetical protein